MKTRIIERASLDTEYKIEPVYELKVEILNINNKKQNRQMNIDDTLIFDSMEKLTDYTGINNIKFNDTNILTDLRNNKHIIMGTKLVDNDAELKLYFEKLDTEINLLKKSK